MDYWLGIARPNVLKDSQQKYDLRSQHPFGFPEGRLKSVQGMKVGDRIVNYVTAPYSRFFAVWEITRPHVHDDAHILAGNTFPFPECVLVKPIVLVSPEAGIENPGIPVRQSAVKVDEALAETILSALRGAEHSREAGDELARLKKLAERATRPGQQQFSTVIRLNYEGRCAITGCETSAALEAAHIRVQRDFDDNSAENGILLRSDIHALFDALLITLSSEGERVQVSEHLTDSSYAFLRDARVSKPSVGLSPSAKNINDHRDRFFRKHLRQL